MQSDRTLPELTRDFASQLGELFRNEVRLARAETVENLKELAGGAVTVAVGVAFAVAGVTLALFALAYALAEAMPLWLAAFIAAAAGGAIGWFLIRAGRKALSPEHLKLSRTAEQVSRDLKLLKENIGHESRN